MRRNFRSDLRLECIHCFCLKLLRPVAGRISERKPTSFVVELFYFRVDSSQRISFSFQIGCDQHSSMPEVDLVTSPSAAQEPVASIGFRHGAFDGPLDAGAASVRRWRGSSNETAHLHKMREAGKMMKRSGDNSGLHQLIMAADTIGSDNGRLQPTHKEISTGPAKRCHRSPSASGARRPRHRPNRKRHANFCLKRSA